jgi:hypothetical protein
MRLNIRKAASNGTTMGNAAIKNKVKTTKAVSKPSKMTSPLMKDVASLFFELSHMRGQKYASSAAKLPMTTMRMIKPKNIATARRGNLQQYQKKNQEEYRYS